LEAARYTGGDVEAAALVAPPAVSGSGVEQTFRVEVPAADLKYAGLVINGIRSGAGACSVYWDVPEHDRRIGNDDGVDSRPMGTAGAASNGQCELLKFGTEVTSNGRNIDLTFHVKFRHTFDGLKQVFLYRKNVNGETSGLRRLGWWWVE
jgi:hypothetical protein